jgi:thiol-disulfide isomerase/thioredoxin
MDQSSPLIEFFGAECSHCRSMEPLIARLQDEEDLTISRLEVWHNEENANLMRQYDQGFCGGVPFFYNTKSGKWICGSTSYEKLKDWALGR